MSPAKISCACMNSSMSCRPVTSSAPSLTMRSAWRFGPKCATKSPHLGHGRDVLAAARHPQLGPSAAGRWRRLGKSSSFTPASRGQVHLAAQNLRPAPGRGAQVNHVFYAGEDVEAVVDLQQLERAARAPSLLLSLAVVDVALILGALPMAPESRNPRRPARRHRARARLRATGFVSRGHFFDCSERRRRFFAAADEKGGFRMAIRSHGVGGRSQRRARGDARASRVTPAVSSAEGLARRQGEPPCVEGGLPYPHPG